jgi:DNA-binding transcriptional MerR regulator
MLRYVENSGLITPARTASGYRVYGPAELQRLRTLKELIAQFDLGLTDMAFAARLNTDPELRAAVQAWLDARPERPRNVEPAEWLSFEQAKHERLLATA